VSVRSDVLLWAQRVLAKAGAPAHQLLEIRADAPPDVVSEAFQRIARMAHPDLHRAGLDAADLETVTSAYSRVAGAYQEMRSARQTTTKIKPIGKDEPQSIIAQRLSGQIKAQTPSAGVPQSEAPTTPSSGVAAHSMNSKALIYYRKAEMALRRGDLRGAVMQMKMAIAGDPGSTFLRAALGEMEKELTKKP
jgi:hypothetical protein